MSSFSYSDDKRQLWHVLVRFIGAPTRSVKTEAISMALRQNGVKTFHNLLSMSENDIMCLEADREEFKGDDLDPKLVPLVMKRKLIIAVALFHHYSRIAKRSIDIRTINRDQYDNFRTSIYDPNVRITPWTVKPPGEATAEANWLKNMRPARTDYKVFNDDKNWLLFKEMMDCTVAAHNIPNMIAPPFTINGTTGVRVDFVPEDRDLDRAQRNWFYKVLQDVCKTPVSKRIVTKHLQFKDTRTIWCEIQEYYDDSTGSLVRSQALMNYLNSTKLSTCGWRTSTQAFVTNYVETIRQYNVLQVDEDKLSNKMQVNMLNTALNGTTHLQDVLNTYYTARN